MATGTEPCSADTLSRAMSSVPVRSCATVKISVF